MIPRNYIMFKGFVRRSIGIPWILTPVRNKVLHDKAFQLIKNGNIISNQKNLTGISKKSEMRYTSTLFNTVTTKSIIEPNDDEMIPVLPEKQEDIFETGNDQILSEPEKPIPKRKRKSDALIESEILEIPKPATNQLIQFATSSKRILRRPDFEIVDHFKQKGGDPTKTLIVFDSNDDPNAEIRCRTYYYDALKKQFVCSRCRHRGKHVPAKIMVKDNEEVVELSEIDHICEPTLYEKVMEKLNPDYIEKPFFEIKEDGTTKNLRIFTNIDRLYGYEFYYYSKEDIFYCKGCKSQHNQFVSAKLIKKDHRDVTRMNKHVCKPKKLQCDISEIEQPDLIWPKANEGIKELETLMRNIREIHPIGKCPLETVTYVITSAPPESSAERKASCILYVGYSEDLAKRIENHVREDGVVAKLIKKFGVLYFIPIFQDIPSACSDLEAMIYDLWNCGSLNFQLRNLCKCSWKSGTGEDGLRIIAENLDHPEHQNLVLAVKKLIVTNIDKAQIIPSREVKRQSRS